VQGLGAISQTFHVLARKLVGEPFVRGRARMRDWENPRGHKEEMAGRSVSGIFTPASAEDLP
jgi:hypothetical protein